MAWRFRYILRCRGASHRRGSNVSRRWSGNDLNRIGFHFSLFDLFDNRFNLNLDVLNNLFRHPYTRIDYVMNDLTVTRQTAARYLDTLAEHGFVEKHRADKNNYYVNTSLVRLLMTVSEET